MFSEIAVSFYAAGWLAVFSTRTVFIYVVCLFPSRFPPDSQPGPVYVAFVRSFGLVHGVVPSYSII